MKNFAITLIKTIRWMTSNGISTELVPKETRRERMELCEACDKLIPITKQCSICSCVMPIKTALVYDPVKSAEQGEDVKTFCPERIWGEFSNT